MTQARARSILDAARTLRASESSRDSLMSIVDQAISNLEKGNPKQALSCLKIIRPALSDTLAYADKYPEVLIQHYTDTMQHKAIIGELQLELARLKHDDELVDACELSSREMDGFFAEAISYLDPGN